jgi:hypothetical protein
LRHFRIISPVLQIVRVVSRPLKIVSKVPFVGKIATAAIPGVGPALAIAGKVSAVRHVAASHTPEVVAMYR